MKPSQTTTKMMALVLLAAVGSGFWAYSHGAQERVSRDTDRSSREYEVVVPPIKSDMERMVEAYERLSDQYLTLVQNQLQRMDADQRMILQKLESIEKKLDELSKKVEPAAPVKSAEPKP
jgi:TolA-binding protein